jgi:hypothetical protein
MLSNSITIAVRERAAKAAAIDEAVAVAIVVEVVTDAAAGVVVTVAATGVPMIAAAGLREEKPVDPIGEEPVVASGEVPNGAVMTSVAVAADVTDLSHRGFSASR